MNALHRIIQISAVVLLYACGADAQPAPQGSAGGGTVVATTQTGSNRSQTITIHMPAPPLHAPVVTGAPYSVEQVSEGTQTLADGTHITQKTSVSKLYRDSEGRTRVERPAFLGWSSGSQDVMIVEISDPVSGFRYVLDPQNHIAHRFAGPDKANEPARYSQETRALPQTGSSAPARQVSSPAPAQANRPENTTESLGTQVIEGVYAEGKKTTTTFPVGMVGNDRPIASVTEYWYSPDLKLTVLSKSSDPRSGEHSTRLQNINRSEPDQALFRVPSDYQIIDENSDRVEIKITRP